MHALRVSITVGLLTVFGADNVVAQAGSELIGQGRYLAIIGGCNDCHTAGYLISEAQVAEENWLLGDEFGWHGPWGTTYASNLRLLVADMTEEQWITMARSLKTRPPMPWWKLHEMKDEDVKALYHFIRHLGPAGKPAPSFLPPDQQPPPPYASFPAPPSQ